MNPVKHLWAEIGWDVVRVVLILALLLVALNWGYFAKQVAAWWEYDLLKEKGAVPSLNLLSGQPNQLAIPSIGMEAPLVYIATTDEVTIQHGLENGVVHYPNTAMPGEVGNAYYFGHSSDYAFKSGQYKTVFATLPRVEVGDAVYITDPAGKQFVYKVKDKKIVGPKDTSVLEQPSGKQKILTLQTSWPLGTALKRYVVVCELVKS